MDSTMNTESTVSPGVKAAGERVIGGRYRVVRVLKHDRSGEHCLARDEETGHEVVVRLMKLTTMSAGMRLRLEHEAEVLQELDTPWIAGVVQVGEDGEHLFVARRFLLGVTLRERLAQGGLSAQDTMVLGRCLFAALQAAHERGVLHYAIRPSNIIVDESGPVATAVLSDFGLGSQAGAEERSAEESVESASYLSPESAGALDHEIDETSDLYSAGIVLFECLSGHPPFRGDKAGAILYQHMTASVPELRSMGVDLPRALDDLIQRLLRKDPRDRYQTAQAVLMDLESILNCGAGHSAFVVGSHDRRPTLTEPALVGREAELGQVEEQIAQVLAGKPSLVYLEAESGGGKTRLLSEIALRGVKAGMWVLRGQGTDQVGQKPLQVLNGIIEQAATAARQDSTFAEALQARLGENVDSVAAALPELARSLGWRPGNLAGSEAFAENRTIQAIGSFLYALGTAERPVLIILDDCQWADELTCKLIRWRPSPSQAGEAHVMTVAAFRSEEVGEGHLLRGIEPTVGIRLAAFTAEETRQLLESMAGKLPEVAVGLITQIAEGNPFMASAVLRGLVESGALIADADGWRVEPLAMADLSSSNRAASFLARRLDLLPAETIRLLSTAAILGKEFDLDSATKLSGQSPSETIASIEEARQRHLVWTRADGSRCVFVHDKIRSALLDRLTFGQRRGLHQEAALYLQWNCPDRVSDIAYHFDAAEDSHSALPYALTAAEQARAQYSLEIAEQQYGIARRGDASADKSVRYRIAEGLGDVLMLRGKYAVAGELFESAAALAEGAYAKAQICGKMGELLLKRGDMSGAARVIEKALGFLDCRVRQKLLHCLVMLAWYLFIQLTHCILPPWLRRRVRGTPESQVSLQMRLLSQLGYVYWFSRGRAQTFMVHLLNMNRAERYAPTLELAQIYSDHAVAMTLLGLYSRGIRYAQRSLEIRRTLGNSWGQGQSLSFYGVVLYAASRFRESIEKCREAVRLLERTGDLWEVHIARYQIAASLYRLGRLREAIDEARQTHLSGMELGDTQASGINLDIWAMASGGKIPDETIQQEIAKERTDLQAQVQVLVAQGIQLTEAGKRDEAVSVLKTAVAKSDQLGLMNAYTAPSLAWLATALRRQAESPSIRTAGKRAKLLQEARTVARRAVRIGRRLQNDLPHALRESAIIYSLTGETGRAHRLFEASLAAAEKQDARYEYALTLFAYGAFGREMGWSKAETQVADAEARLTKLREPIQLNAGDSASHAKSASLSLYDRFDNVLVSGRKIASALSGAAIFDEARGAALRLLRAEHCVVLQILGDVKKFRLIHVSGGSDVNFDEVLVRKALEAGKAIAGEEDSPPSAIRGGGELRHGSALCVPLYVRGRAVACLCVVHRHIQKLFGPDEERLADFIAAIAGAALENAEGFKLLQQLNSTLEQRIVERTAAAESRARELAQSNQELERMASELLQTQEQLHVAMQAAKSANEAKSRFLATMSHEIRTPMNGIIGMTELTLSTSLTGQQRSYLTTLKDSSHLLLEIINDILDFSKIEAGKMELESIPCNIRRVVEDVVRLLAVSASKKNLELVCRIAGGVPETAVGDPNRLRQIIVNLVGNAIKFTEQGEILVRVELEEITDAELHLRFTVQDTGIGIPADKIGHIFEAFRQSDSSVTRRFGGTGLGLSISAQLAELMGGRIWVESEVGQGSTFHFSATFERPGSADACVAKPRLSGYAVIVSENRNVRENCREILDSAGMATCVGENGESARAAILAANAESWAVEGRRLLVVDAGMNRAEGFELMESLRRDETAGWQIIMLTPAGMADGVERCQKLGIQHCVSKPVKATELLEAARAAMHGGPGDAAAATCAAEADRNMGLRVLVADDSPVNQEVTSGLLELRGHTVQVADNGEEAVEAFRSQRFDVILMDVEMPGMDGLTAAATIRGLETAGEARVPILAMTAHVLDSVKKQCHDAGMDGYISKPVQPAELYRAIETHCGRPADMQPPYAKSRE
jgi:signal transduction histidine kinase/CheY-like chemotaxis protein